MTDRKDDKWYSGLTWRGLAKCLINIAIHVGYGLIIIAIGMIIAIVAYKNDLVGSDGSVTIVTVFAFAGVLSPVWLPYLYQKYQQNHKGVSEKEE